MKTKTMKTPHTSKGKKVSKKIMTLADTIMETSYTASHLMTREMKEYILRDLNYSEDHIESMDDQEITSETAYQFGFSTWVTGYYSDFDVCLKCLSKYFKTWGE